jgi:hypothetical protein
MQQRRLAGPVGADQRNPPTSRLTPQTAVMSPWAMVRSLHASMNGPLP